MNERQEQLLSLIVSEYTQTATPVGSKSLAENRELDVSSATIRNDMAELETEGYIFQPHTSAGRVPTTKGYQYFVDHFVTADKQPSKNHQQQLEKGLHDFKQYQPEAVKSIAKATAELVDGAVFVGFSHMNVYYTGLSNLFRQPEFREQNLLYGMSQIIDHLDLVLAQLFDQTKDDTLIMIGDRNPFGKDCGALVTPYKNKKTHGMIGILGPIRMDYQRNASVLNYVRTLMSNY
jgi:transcriptional regulator of heat shock response